MKATITAVFLIVITLASTIGFCQSTSSATSAPAPSATFTNPLLPTGPDPWVIAKDGYYYYMNTVGDNLTIWKTRSLPQLKNAEKKVVWRPPASGPYSHEIWAPELHR